MHLSPMLVALFATTTTISLSDSAMGETPEPVSNSDQLTSEQLSSNTTPVMVSLAKPESKSAVLHKLPSAPSNRIEPELISTPIETNTTDLELSVVKPDSKSKPVTQISRQTDIATAPENIWEQVEFAPVNNLLESRGNLNENSVSQPLSAVEVQEIAKTPKEELETQSLVNPAEINPESSSSSIIPPSPAHDLIGVLKPTIPSGNLVAEAQAIPQTAQNPTPSGESAPEPLVLVGEVVVQGATGELENLIYETIRTRPGSTTTRSQLQEDLNAIFATGLFSNAQAIPEDTPLGVRITFQVQPNPVLREVVIDNVTSSETQVLPPEEVDRIFGAQYGQILNLQDLQQDIKELNEWYQTNGYDLAQVVGSPEITPDGVVTLVVAEGVIEDVRVRYLDEDREELEDGRTREFVITREVELQSGDVFNRNTARRDLQRVFGLGLFDDVQLSFSPGSDPSRVIVNVDVVEGSTGSLAAGAGFSSASGLFGTVSYQQRNFGGNNQTLGGEVQLGTRSLLFDVRFTDPWIGGDPYRTSYTVNAFRRRSISLIFDGGEEDIDLENGDTPRVVRTGGGVTFSRPLSQNVFEKAEWNASLGLQYQRVAIEDSDGDVTPRDENGNLLSFNDSGEDDLFLVQFGIVRDQRNSALQPTRGSFLRLGLDQSIPIGAGSIFMNRLRASYSFYLPVNFTDFSEGPETLAFNVQAGNIIGDLPPYEAFAIGGTNSVRGFDEGDVGSGRRYIQATAEYRFPILSIFSGALFADFGSDLGSGSSVPGDPAGERDKPGTGLGYGLGVRIQSPLGPIRIDYGLNTEGDNRFHFGIGERF